MSRLAHRNRRNDDICSRHGHHALLSKPEERQDGYDDDDQANEINDAVHVPLLLAIIQCMTAKQLIVRIGSLFASDVRRRGSEE